MKVKNYAVRHIAAAMGLTYLAGVIIYTIGFWHGAGTFFSSLLLALLSSLEMFTGHSDLVEVSDALKDGSSFYMICFSLVHFIAVLLSIAFLLDIFGKRLLSMLRTMLYHKNISDRKVYIFDGTDENCISIAKSIPQDQHNIIIFVRSMVDSDVKAFSLLEIIMSGVKHHFTNDECKSIGGRVCHSELPLSVALMAGKGWLYKGVVKIMESCMSSEIFLLSWDSETNAEAAYKLSNALSDGLNAKIHAGVNMGKPHALKLKGCKYVVSANRSESVVDTLMEKTSLLSMGNDRKTLILGFGYTSRRSIELLVDNGFTKMDVVSPEVAKSSEKYLCFHPAYRKMKGMRFFTYDTKSNAFWDYLHENMESISNVIVFGQEPARNFEDAMLIKQYAESTGKDMDDFRIYMMEYEAQPGDSDGCIEPFGKREDVYNFQRISKLKI